MIFNAVPLRDAVIFPGVVTPLFIGRKKSVESVEHAHEKRMQIVLLSQKNAEVEKPGADDVYDVGTLVEILEFSKLPDGTLKLLIEGIRRVKINQFLDDDLMECEVQLLVDENKLSDKEKQSMRLMLLQAFERYLRSIQKNGRELLKTLQSLDNLSLLTDAIVSNIHLPVDKKIAFLIDSDIESRITEVMLLLEKESEVVELERIIRERVKAQMDKNQREYYLNEQVKAIQKELEGLDGNKTDFGQLEESIIAAKMPEAAFKKCMSDLEKLKKMPLMSSEAVVLRNYLEAMIEYPWSKSSTVTTDLSHAKTVLESSHYGLEDVKARIIEHLAVQQRTQKPSGTILCLVGPPGVGKTSIGKIIAQAVNREYVRMALGGVRDEAEIRGHRRTYIGALPGKIVQNITKTGVNNPLFLLDEIDKMGMDHRGDPASAMLEVLDPEQNHTFNDHYMEVDIDLSNVMFVATANSLDIPEALRDRMEIIRIPGYTESEKIEIAKNYLLPRSIEKNALTNKEINITDKALRMIVENYTREAGVRQLDREIAKICRKVITEISLGEHKKVSVSQNNLAHYLGPIKYQRDGLQPDSIGRINGLAWTSVGGELLSIEVAILPGKGKVDLTGKLGDVMKESVQAAMTVAKTYVGQLGVLHTFFQEHDFHIHLPEAATPKDGPSAGTAIATALISAIMQLPISNQIAMTGEITLQGRVLEIGGLKEKLFAAVRENVKTVFIPQANEKDLPEIPDEIKNALKIIPVTHIEQIISQVFSNKLVRVEKIVEPGFLIQRYLPSESENICKH